jgi:leucine dehydrogenase
MEWIASETPWVTGVPPELGGGGDPSPVTALGVLQGIRASAQRLWGSPALEGKHVAIQGLGSVGGYLAGYLRDEGARISGCDIDEEAVSEARELGVDIVPPDAIYDVACDVFAPCALGAILNDDTIPRLRAKVVAGGANNQLADPARHGAAIERRGILYAPDFVINAGGLINVFQEFIGYDQDRALRRARGIYDSVLRVYAIAEREKVTSAVAADRLAEERIASVKALGPRHWDRAVLDRLASSH